MSEFGPVDYSASQVLDLLKEVVEEVGENYVYPIDYTTGIRSGNGCHYVRNGEPSCIIGRLVVKMGASVDWLKNYEATGAKFVLGHVTFESSDPWKSKRPFRVSENTADVLNRAQAKQDQGVATWGEILAFVEDQLRQTGELE